MATIRLVLGNLLVFACMLLVGACGLEVWARTKPANSFLTFDPELGYALRPGAEGVYRGLSMLDPNPAIHTEVHVDAMGLRGPEREIARTPGRPRALILGDSFVEAFEVPYDETFYARIEQRARAQGTPIELVPMGVMGYGQAQELLWLRERGVALRPDLVVDVVFIGNDISDDSYDLSPTDLRPYFELDEGTLRLTRLPGMAARLKYRAASLLRSYRVYKELGARIPALRSIAIDLGLSNRGQAGVQHSAKRDALVRAGYQLTFALLREMRQTVQQAGSRFAIAFYGDWQTGSAVSADALFRHFCAESRIDCLDLNDDIAGKDAYIVPNDHHWNAAGHRLVADRMWSRWFEKLASGHPPADTPGTPGRGAAGAGTAAYTPRP